MTTVLITGASSGMGKAMAERFIHDGYTVYAAARRVEEMRDLETLGATALPMDITVSDDVERVVAHVIDREGGVDVLINNAGFGLYGAVEDTSIDDARYQFEVNLFGLADLTKRVLPGMRGRGAGKIVNISSMGGEIYTPLGAWYHATKHALEAWSDCLRYELAPFGIDVIIVRPGIIDTQFADVMTGPLLERSGDTAYAQMARDVAAATRETYDPNRATPPEAVAKTVAAAVRAGKPRTRYSVGRLAKPMIFLRRVLPDRAFDWVLSRAT